MIGEEIAMEWISVPSRRRSDRLGAMVERSNVSISEKSALVVQKSEESCKSSKSDVCAIRVQTDEGLEVLLDCYSLW